MTAPLLILAATPEQAGDYAHRHNLGPEGGRWRHIAEMRHVLGRRGPGRFIVLPVPDGEELSRRDRNNRAEALRYLLAHGFTETR